MAQTSGFEYDIFISYAHDDNYGLGNRDGWVDSFECMLGDWLRKRRRFRNFKIWFDRRRMHGNTRFDEAIENALKDTAFFFALISRNYLRSDYCRKELSWFTEYHRKSQFGLQIGETSRIYNILLHNIPHTQWFPELSGTSGFSMNDAKIDAEFGEFTSPDDQLFEKQMRPIVDSIEAIVRKINPVRHSASADFKKKRRSVSIFMADVPDTLQNFKNLIISSMEPLGVDILTDVPPPMDAAGHYTAASSALSRSDISVHLLDPCSGRQIIDRKHSTYVWEQHELAGDNEVFQLVWGPAVMDCRDVDDREQRQFLLECENCHREYHHYQFIQCGKTEFVDILKHHINRIQDRSAGSSEMMNYLIDTHLKDQKYAFMLANFLVESGAQVEFNQESIDPDISLTRFEQSVKHARNLIFVFGEVGKRWLEGRITKVFNTIAGRFDDRDSINLKYIWIFLTPTSGGTINLPSFPEWIHIRIIDNSHIENIDPEVAGQLLVNEGWR